MSGYHLPTVQKKKWATTIHRLLPLFAFVLSSLPTQAQKELPLPPIPFMRELSHIKIDRAQQKILLLNTNKDSSLFLASDNDDINLLVTQQLKVGINNLQAIIETDSLISEPAKYKWLRSLETILLDFATLYHAKLLTGARLGDLITAYTEALQLAKKDLSIEPVIKKNELEICNILLTNEAFVNNIGKQACDGWVIFKECVRFPDNTLKIVKQNLYLPFVDSMVALYAIKHPEDLYNYAAGKNDLGLKIRQNQFPIVKSIALMANMGTGRMYFPFLDKIYKKEISIQAVGKALEKDDDYYKLLVKTQIEYTNRLQQGDTPLVYKVLTDKLKDKAISIYIDEINALHDEKNEHVRFKKIAPLTPQELYYLCVLGEEEIYTSSYLGVYKRMFERMKVPKSDSLLLSVHHDFYRKFIKMAAGFNTLDDFLNKMDSADAVSLIKKFVGSLGAGETLEDAVDVANSFASIQNKAIKTLIIDEIQQNLQATAAKKEKHIYSILNDIFLSADTSNNIDLANKLGIDPVFTMPVDKLRDSTNDPIYIQQFFYGDKDGMNVFKSFLANFKNPNWQIIQKPEWVEVKSIKSKVPVVIYSNKPLDELQDLDAIAQKHLGEYLDSLEIMPKVTFHRGHSYYLKSTIKQMSTAAKLILLGSCGSYQSLHDVLDICPGAQIISSKQVGTGIINQAIINIIAEHLKNGKDLSWLTIWKDLEKQFTKATKERFDDYIPPFKNLGAIFLIAYNKSSE